MINIPKQLWYVVAPSREENLAYMTYCEDNAAFLKRKATGVDWANRSNHVWNREKGCYEYPDGKVEDGVIIDNNPSTGIYIGSSVSRWSTSNKLFRVQDPRGFTVEVPTDNIATLLHLTTVTNGIIQEPCVWAREGNNHVLLPVNSEPYLKTLDQMDTLANKLIKVSELKVGDIVKFFEDDEEYTYLGKAKTTWRLKPYIFKRGDYCNRTKDEKTYSLPERTIKDTKWEAVFAYKSTYGEEGWRYNTYSSPKITEVVGYNTVWGWLQGSVNLYAPQRISNQETSNYCDFSIESVEWK